MTTEELDSTLSPVEAIERATFYQEEPAQVPPADIVAYNELRSCADLFRMHTQGILDLQPDFQRDVVWKGPAQTRFIDSLIKQLPIPSMCFAMDYKAQRWIVIDGLQRISTIVRFLSGGDWTLSTLEDVDPGLAGKSAAAIKNATDGLHDYYTRVENLSIPITVLRCTFTKKTHLDYLFTIFHRLNTGGVKLNNQEIRNCIYSGAFNKLLRVLDETPSWRRFNRMEPNNKYRFTKQEMILRMLAFGDSLAKYEGNLAGFLNDYMDEHRDAKQDFIDMKSRLFIRTSDFISQKIFDVNIPSRISITLLEGLLVGVSKNIDYLETVSSEDAKQMYQGLENLPDYSDSSILEGLSKRPRVESRIRAAIAVFQGT